MRRGTYALVGAIGALVAAASTPSARADLAHEAEIAALRHRLRTTPRDVDARLALALRLSWVGDLPAAKLEAERVIVAAPTYWDAHLLLARIDGWSGRYAAARERLDRVLGEKPGDVEALTLAVDIELWSGRPQAARARADALIAVDDSAEARFRRARAAELEMSVADTRLWARRVLEADPDHRGARGLLENAHLVRVVSASEIEVFPIDKHAVAFGQTVLGTMFPRARWSATVGYEYRRRFATDNHRASVAAAHRITPQLDVDALVRAGSTEVVAELTASAGLDYRWRRHYTLGLRYQGDKMPWPGQLHRISASAVAGLPAGATLSATYEAGLLRYCSKKSPVQSVALRGNIERGWLTAGLVYAFGMELDRAPLPPFLEARFGDDVCAADAMGEIDVSLGDTRAQVLGAEIGYLRAGLIGASAGYTINLRFTGELVHMSHLSLRFWF